ncbi:MAG: hypothetical protein LRY43_02350 [Gammaproteobacteria bacterium]|nr:hypothetical protein [Gammaproteobacteria bacterium]
MTQKIAMCVAYDGTRYHGWQKQTSSEGVQAFIETALTRMAKHPVEVHCAGRTDAGVHASKQVIHFETPTQRDAREWIHGTKFFIFLQTSESCMHNLSILIFMLAFQLPLAFIITLLIFKTFFRYF